MEQIVRYEKKPSRLPWIAVAVASGLLVLAGVAGFFFAICTLLGNSDAAKLALATAQAKPAFTDRIGQPATAGRIVTGSVQLNNDDGSAELTIPVSGPKGKGKLFVEAKKNAGRWQLNSLFFAPEDAADTLDLLHTGGAKPPESTW